MSYSMPVKADERRLYAAVATHIAADPRESGQMAESESPKVPGYVAHAPVGSEFIWPERVGNDHDVVCQVTDLTAAAVVLSADGWVKENADSYPEAGSWRKGRNNLILTDNHSFFRTFQVASELCKFLVANGGEAAIVQRDVRVHLHKVIRVLGWELAGSQPVNLSEAAADA